jgi:hypothetical protein
MHGRGQMFESGEGGQSYEGEWVRGVIKEIYSRSGPEVRKFQAEPCLSACVADMGENQ